MSVRGGGAGPQQTASGRGVGATGADKTPSCWPGRVPRTQAQKQVWGGVAYEALAGHLGGDVELAVSDSSLELRRKVKARDVLGAITPQMVESLMTREWTL